MRWSTLLFGLGIVFLASCKPEVDEFVPGAVVPIPRGNILDFYKLMPGETDTVFTLPGPGHVLVRSRTGVLIDFPDSAWTTSNGQVVTVPVTVRWKEIRSLVDQVSRQLSMRTYDQHLNSRIRFRVSGEKEGETLFLSKPILIQWPDAGGGQPAVWKGSRPTPWDFRWVEAPGTSISLTSWTDPLNGAGVTGYLMAIPAEGFWCAGTGSTGVDADPDIRVQMPSGFSENNTAVYWLDSQAGAAYALDYLGDGAFVLENIQAGSSGRLFSITEAVQNNFYSAWVDRSPGAGGIDWAPLPEKRSLNLVREMLSTL